jgi:hypothetical protein
MKRLTFMPASCKQAPLRQMHGLECSPVFILIWHTTFTAA